MPCWSFLAPDSATCNTAISCKDLEHSAKVVEQTQQQAQELQQLLDGSETSLTAHSQQEEEEDHHKAARGTANEAKAATPDDAFKIEGQTEEDITKARTALEAAKHNDYFNRVQEALEVSMLDQTERDSQSQENSQEVEEEETIKYSAAISASEKGGDDTITYSAAIRAKSDPREVLKTAPWPRSVDEWSAVAQDMGWSPAAAAWLDSVLDEALRPRVLLAAQRQVHHLRFGRRYRMMMYSGIHAVLVHVISQFALSGPPLISQ